MKMVKKKTIIILGCRSTKRKNSEGCCHEDYTLCVVTPCTLVDVYRRFGNSFCLTLR